MAASRLKNVLPLHVFVRRQQVLKMYRDFRRAVRGVADDHLRDSIKGQVLHEFRSNRDLTDTVAIKTLLNEAKRNLEKLRAMGGGGDVTAEAVPAAAAAAEADGGGELRVGTGWPWQRGNNPGT